MSYDHSEKIGNEGDLPKHAVIASLASAVLGDNSLYVETHAARAYHQLRSGGEWVHGVGEFALRLRNLTGDRTDLAESLRPLQPYVEATRMETGLIEGGAYPGSAGLVLRVTAARGVRPRLALCEFDQGTAALLKSQVEGYGDQVRIEPGDGYQFLTTVLERERPTLVFLDPVSVHRAEARRIIASLAKLLSRGVPFVCWTPLNGDGGNRPSAACQRVRVEGACFDVIGWTSKMSTYACGCQLIYSPELRGQIRAVLDSLCSMMGPPWKIRERG